MSGIRTRIETWFEKLAHAICDNPYKTPFVMLALVAAFAFQVPKITIDMTMEVFLHEDDPSLIDCKAFKDQFGRDQRIVIALSPPDVFDEKFLIHLKKLHHDLEENVPTWKTLPALSMPEIHMGQDQDTYPSIC